MYIRLHVYDDVMTETSFGFTQIAIRHNHRPLSIEFGSSSTRCSMAIGQGHFITCPPSAVQVLISTCVRKVSMRM